MRWKYVAGVAILVFAGCAGAPPANRSFTREWADHMKRDDEFKARKQKLRPKDDDVQSRSETHPETRGQYKPHEQDGFPIGGDTGLGGIIDTDGAGINYRVKW